MPLTEVMKEKLKKALEAERIAVVGASGEQLSVVGMGLLCNLLSACFPGEVIPVNPKHDRILGRKCYPDIESVQPPPDLAILLLNRHAAMEMVERAARCGVQAVTVVAGGFREAGTDEGRALEEKLRELASRYELPVIGPNTVGFSCLHRRLHGVFWHLDAVPGPVALLTQSGGVGLTIANSLRSIGCGLSHFIGVGNRCVVDFPDYLDALWTLPEIKGFCLFVEGVDNPRRLYQSLRRISPHKPVVVYKAGKNEEVSRATVTHTGSLAGEYHLYRAAFKQAGAVEVESSAEAAVASKALCMQPPPEGNRLCVLTFTAGPGIVAMDRLLEAGWELPELSPRVKSAIQSIIGENTPVKIQNPVDLTGPGFLPTVYTRVMDLLLEEPFDAYLLVWTYNPHIRVPAVELQGALKPVRKSVVVAFLGHHAEAMPWIEDLYSRGICAYLTTEDAALALNALLARSRFLAREP